MIIFARPQATELQLIVARITPAPPPPSLRLPRPDDPTPRRPPLRFDRSSSAGSNAFMKKRTNSVSVVADLGSGVRLGADASFKVPEMPRSAKGKEREVVADDDVFGQGAVENKGKRKRDESDRENEIEKANKTVRAAPPPILRRVPDAQADNKAVRHPPHAHSQDAPGVQRRVWGRIPRRRVRARKSLLLWKHRADWLF
jgi:hypothetical protein